MMTPNNPHPHMTATNPNNVATIVNPPILQTQNTPSYLTAPKMPVGALTILKDLQPCMYSPVPIRALLRDGKPPVLKALDAHSLQSMNPALRHQLHLFYRTVYPLFGVDRDSNVTDFCLDDDDAGSNPEVVPPIPTGITSSKRPRSPLSTNTPKSSTSGSSVILQPNPSKGCTSSDDSTNAHGTSSGQQHRHTVAQPATLSSNPNLVRGRLDDQKIQPNHNQMSQSVRSSRGVNSSTLGPEDPYEAYRRRAAEMAKQQREFGGVARCSYFHTREGCRRGHRCPFLHEKFIG